MNILVGGVNGVGKSTILRRVAQLDGRFEVVHYTSALMQQMGLAPGDYDDLRRFTQAQRTQATVELMKNLTSRQTSKFRLIDGHYLTLVWGEVTNISGPWVASLDALILITAAPEVVWRRISSDEYVRDRELFAVDSNQTDRRTQLTSYITQTEAEFDKLVLTYQKPHFRLDHSTDDVDRAAEQIINFISSL
jgi:adenylate kinase